MTSLHRSVMTLFSSSDSVYSHRARIILAEKDIQADIQYVQRGDEPDDLLDLNPYASLPTLVDRDLALYDSRVVADYLDERFPHPPMMPVDPVSRAQARLALYRIETDWYTLVDAMGTAAAGRGNDPATALRDSLTAAAEVFAARPFFLNDEFSMADAWIAPVLWRLPYWGIKLPRAAEPVRVYAESIFAREGFRRSLSEDERALR